MSDLSESEKAALGKLVGDRFNSLVDDYASQARDQVDACLAQGVSRKVAVTMVGLSLTVAGLRCALYASGVDDAARESSRRDSLRILLEIARMAGMPVDSIVV